MIGGYLLPDMNTHHVFMHTHVHTCMGTFSAQHGAYVLLPDHRLLGAIAGNYSLSVANKVGDNLKGSPFAIAVQPGPISAAHCSVQLLQSGSILAGTELQLKLNAVDMFANQVGKCGASLDLLCFPS